MTILPLSSKIVISIICWGPYTQSTINWKVDCTVQGDGEAGDAVRDGGGDRDAKAGEQNGGGGNENTMILTGENKNE